MLCWLANLPPKISHHILALYGTGAGASSLQKGFDGNANYQRPALPQHEKVVQELQTWDHARRCLGREAHYTAFLGYFQAEIAARGWHAVVADHLFKGDAAADDMLARLFAGFLHPLIQLMYGMEWDQPAIVAEALAQTAVHGTDLKSFLLESERVARESSEPEPAPRIAELLEAVRADETLARAAHMEDGNKIRDGVLVRARDEMIRLAGRVRVLPDELEERTAEMFDTCLYMAAAAAIRSGKQSKFDFLLMCVSPYSPLILSNSVLACPSHMRNSEKKIW